MIIGRNRQVLNRASYHPSFLYIYMASPLKYHNFSFAFKSQTSTKILSQTSFTKTASHSPHIQIPSPPKITIEDTPPKFLQRVILATLLHGFVRF